MVQLTNIYFNLFLIFYINSNVNGLYRILIISPFNMKSHNAMLETVGKALALNGHKVDIISHFELKNSIKNYTTIINLDGTMPQLVNSLTMKMIDYLRKLNIVSGLIEKFGSNYCELMSSEKIKKFIKNPPTDPPYDLVITQAMSTNCYFAFGDVFNVPVVGVSPVAQFTWFDEILGNSMCNSYVANWETKNSQIKTFWDRVKNHFWTHYHNYRFFKDTEKNQTEAIRKYLNPNMANIREIEKKISLHLVNSYQSVFGIRPLSPAIVQIGGIQIELSESKITPELKIWMDESTEGVIYFSLGSMVILEDFPKDVLLGIYASFAKLSPMRILMKILNNSTLPPGLPDNVLTMSWIPQIPILQHKNTKVFITHGGLNSMMEAISFAVPMIGFPFVSDQFLNIRTLAEKNVVYEMDYKEISEKTLDVALNAVLYDSKYRKAAKRESQLFRDRPMNATKTAVFWIEYIIRNGANSLRSPTMDMPWWQAELVDIYGFIFISFLLISYMIFHILKKITRLLYSILNYISQGHKKKD
ncbi:UDP-glucosyltransferase 2-like isoform X2 [Leptopilina boulardi]|uniref:UDP-glucosyltransferase 2-like isoform X2 n=1 Tax=Leptopilina boulardi TaxID=63433 RepID=UPI0021F5DA78|nr:UDP-glucosyltransferase 2-like isoform X2 [Leptopilina boulardi]